MNNRTALLRFLQMAEADRLTVGSGIPANTPMENAGAAVAREIRGRWAARPVTVLCGPGNNGGDGFVAARLLAAAGWPVRLALLAAREHLTGEARHHAALWSGPVETLSPRVLDGGVIDALLGAGLSRAVGGAAAETLAAAAKRGCPVVAIDVPSGLMGATGAVSGAVPAVVTVTYFRKKPGHLPLPGRLLCREVVVADIGMPATVFESLTVDTYENDSVL